jgi:hypothetical protein
VVVDEYVQTEPNTQGRKDNIQGPTDSTSPRAVSQEDQDQGQGKMDSPFPHVGHESIDGQDDLVNDEDDGNR